MACSVFPDRGLNPFPLHFQLHCYPLCHLGNPYYFHKVSFLLSYWFCGAHFTTLSAVFIHSSFCTWDSWYLNISFLACLFEAIANISWLVFFGELENTLPPHTFTSTCSKSIVRNIYFSRSVISDSLQTHGLQHARPPCPSPTPGAYSNSWPLIQWCHPTISSSVIPFSSCLQSFPASGSFQMSQLFPSSGQSIGVSASSSVLPMNIQDWFPLGWTGWICLLPRDSQVSSPTPHFRSINSLALSFLYTPTLTSIHDCWKNHSFD